VSFGTDRTVANLLGPFAKSAFGPKSGTALRSVPLFPPGALPGGPRRRRCLRRAAKAAPPPRPSTLPPFRAPPAPDHACRCSKRFGRVLLLLVRAHGSSTLLITFIGTQSTPQHKHRHPLLRQQRWAGLQRAAQGHLWPPAIQHFAAPPPGASVSDRFLRADAILDTVGYPDSPDGHNSRQDVAI
jgi:hypothetical protein